ncbi:ADP-ribosylglycohydrolase family protein, partial [Altericroceibacterium xinjiangense]|uniref:ADP-ribosylglycohydrolase family protein n=1 Tax=Altericroceibacterium xinjiangense TaxID=762261 RepID=UPI0019D31E02
RRALHQSHGGVIFKPPATHEIPDSPGAIETAAQLNHVLELGPKAEKKPDTSLIAARDRAIGSLLGLAVGDALGTTLEFTMRDTHPRLTAMEGGGPFHLEPGQWTDDTAMALALGDSLIARGGLDESDLMDRFARWRDEGEYSCTGTCFDIGRTVRGALSRYKQTGDPAAGSTDPRSAGNGSLMRLAPVAIRYWQDRKTLHEIAARQSRTTHGAPEAVDACVAYADILADAIEGRPRSEVLRPRSGPYAGRIESIVAGSWRSKSRGEIRSSGYVAHSLEAALWCVGRTASFYDAVLLAANLAEDADTTAAITGQLAGALYGASGISSNSLGPLAWKERIEEMAASLFEQGVR